MAALLPATFKPAIRAGQFLLHGIRQNEISVDGEVHIVRLLEAPPRVTAKPFEVGKKIDGIDARHARQRSVPIPIVPGHSRKRTKLE